jgi:pyruvate,water dikinase
MFKFLRRFLKEAEDGQVSLREKFNHFRRLLESNNQALEIMADMEEKLSGEFLFDTGYLYTQAAQLGDHVSLMVSQLNRLTQKRYRELAPICQGLKEEIQRELAAVPAIPETPYILPLEALTRETAPSVGGKMANLGEIRNRLRLMVPEGFAISATAYQRFLEASGLARELATRLAQARIDDLESLEATCQDLQTLVRQAPLPADLMEALAQASQAMSGLGLAVRSSAVGEDTDFSFAGQFATLLNVDAAQLPQHYKEIVASKFTSRAIFYWKYQHFTLNELPMAVGVLEMVPARASGVMFSVDPHAPEANTAIITAVWGLGKYAVDGTITPDLFVVDRGQGHAVKQQRVTVKPVALTISPQGGVAESALASEQAQAPCLTEPQIQRLAALALRLEKHFGRPQDI